MHHIALLTAIILSALAAVAFAFAVAVLSRKLLAEQQRSANALDHWIGAYQHSVNTKHELKEKLNNDLRAAMARTQQAETRARLASERADRAERQVRHLESQAQRAERSA